MASKKIAETPDFVRGLLNAADKMSNSRISNKVASRDILSRSGDELASLSPADVQELGSYQARVVLVVLGAELALKFLWQHVQDGKCRPAWNDHELSHWFNKLPCSLKAQIEIEYLRLSEMPPVGWKSAKDVFEFCEGASVKWRYLVEEDSFPDYVMQANCLKDAVLSVLQVANAVSSKE